MSQDKPTMLKMINWRMCPTCGYKCENGSESHCPEHKDVRLKRAIFELSYCDVQALLKKYREASKGGWDDNQK